MFCTRRTLATLVLLLAAGCGKDQSNPFDRLNAARPPSDDAVLLFLSGSWASEAGQARELFALNADGSVPEQLTHCAENSTPCDFLQVAPASLLRSRVAAVRTTPDAEAGTAALYFMDLSRGVETLIVPRRGVSGVDWSPDDSFLLYSSTVSSATGGSGVEDLFYVYPDGTNDQDLTLTADIRERSPRLDPFGRTAVYESIDATRVGRIYLYPGTALTSGPTSGEPLAGTPYVVGADADPVISPDGTTVAFRRLTSTGSGGLGTWDILRVDINGGDPEVVATGPVFRGAPDWGPSGLLYVETDAASSESRLVVVQPDGTGRAVLRTENAGFRMAAPRWLRGS
jgi:Tol biopolymer transport system component